ncbi:MAG TPA: ATP-binding protein [Gemmataceae bacterium]|jgi:signal transduction histidine kinase
METIVRYAVMAASLLLVAGCVLGAFSLNHQYGEVSRVLKENVDSALADKELETTLDELVRLLRAEHAPIPPQQFAAELTKRHDKASRQLEQVVEYANSVKEKERVNEVAESWARYWKRWSARPRQGEKDLPEFDRGLARQLNEEVRPLCSRLLEYNMGQVSDSEETTRRIVDRLTWGLLAVGVVAPLAGLLLGFAVARRMHQSIGQLSVRIRDAAGRLSSELRPVTLESDGSTLALNGQMQVIVEEIERVFERLHQREHEVLRAEQLAAVGQVAAGMAHELRNPLTSVKMLVQTGLEGDPPGGLPGEDLSIIEHEVRRMEACIQTFLDFARPPGAERRRTDLLAVVRRALTLLEGRARRQKVLIKTAMPPEPVGLCIDGEQIHQVMVNLMLNALDAMPHGGELRLEVRPATGDPPRVAVRIHDTGPGIAAPILARLFEPFVSGKETGLGLGLSICRRLLEANGGGITGANDPEGGAAFTFTLPA